MKNPCIPIDIWVLDLIESGHGVLNAGLPWEVLAIATEQPRDSTRSLGILTAEEERVLRTVLSALRQVRFGHVQILLHDGKAVQIDRLEKERL